MKLGNMDFSELSLSCIYSLACLAAGGSAALRSWLHTCRLSSLACLTSVCSDRLHFCFLWPRCCSVAVALSSRSRCNLSLALSRFICVELHGEESSVAFSRSIGVEFSEGSIVSTCTEQILILKS